MNPTNKNVLFWSGHTALTGLSTVLIAWSVFPIGGATLPHHMEEVFRMAFTSSALFVGVLCGLLTAATMAFPLMAPRPVEAEGPPEREAFDPPGNTPEQELKNEH